MNTKIEHTKPHWVITDHLYGLGFLDNCQHILGNEKKTKEYLISAIYEAWCNNNWDLFSRETWVDAYSLIAEDAKELKEREPKTTVFLHDLHKMIKQWAKKIRIHPPEDSRNTDMEMICDTIAEYIKEPRHNKRMDYLRHMNDRIASIWRSYDNKRSDLENEVAHTDHYV